MGGDIQPSVRKKHHRLHGHRVRPGQVIFALWELEPEHFAAASPSAVAELHTCAVTKGVPGPTEPRQGLTGMWKEQTHHP